MIAYAILCPCEACSFNPTRCPDGPIRSATKKHHPNKNSPAKLDSLRKMWVLAVVVLRRRIGDHVLGAMVVVRPLVGDLLPCLLLLMTTIVVSLFLCPFLLSSFPCFLGPSASFCSLCSAIPVVLFGVRS